jgi:hypothetical protein
MEPFDVWALSFWASVLVSGWLAVVYWRFDSGDAHFHQPLVGIIFGFSTGIFMTLLSVLLLIAQFLPLGPLLRFFLPPTPAVWWFHASDEFSVSITYTATLIFFIMTTSGGFIGGITTPSRVPDWFTDRFIS